MTTLVVEQAEVGGRVVDVAIRGHRIAAVGERLAIAGPVERLPARGGALLPGLHDHHVHLLAMAAALASIDVAGAADLAAIGRSHRNRPPGDWLRVVGYHESDHGPLDRYLLDQLAPGRPVRVQHQTGVMWVLSSAALDAIGLAAHPTGRLIGEDDRLQHLVPPPPLDLGAVGAQLAAFGVTGVTDATPSRDLSDVELIAAAVGDGRLPQHLVVTGAPDLALRASPWPGVDLGPVKVVLADHALPALDELIAAFAGARRLGRTVAVHCVTRASLVLAVVAWQEAGAVAGDRIEHGSVVPPELAAAIADLGLTVVTQPSFIRDRGDRYLRDVDPEDRPHLYPCGRLQAGGIAVAGSTDAPFGDPDPWRAIASAVDRRTRAGAVLGPEEGVSPRRALELFLGAPDRPGGPPRGVAPGARADLCLLDAPLADVLAAPSADRVAATVIGGSVVWIRR